MMAIKKSNIFTNILLKLSKLKSWNIVYQTFTIFLYEESCPKRKFYDFF